MTETTRLSLPLVQPAQAQKHVTVNETFERLDSLVQLVLAEVDAVTPPASPNEGDVYAVGSGAINDWSGQDGAVAIFSNGGWFFLSPRAGWRAWRADTGGAVSFDGAAWVEGAGSLSINGAGFVHRTIEVDHALTAGATSDVAALIPANSVVYGITGRVLSDIGGASSFEIGVSGATDRYGAGIGVVATSWARGLTGAPLTYYADTDVLLTSVGGAFDGTGTFRIAVHFAEITLPRA